MARKIEGRKFQENKVFSIIVDGNTEVWYLQMLKDHEQLTSINIRPELPKKKKLSEIYELVRDNSNDYDKVFWVVDLDTIIRESAESIFGQKTKLQEFKEYVEKLNKIENVEVLINAPCLEFWFLLHFKETNKYFLNCGSAEKELKIKYLLSYEKTEKYFKKKK